MIIKIFLLTFPLFLLIGCATSSELKRLKKDLSNKISNSNYEIEDLENKYYKLKKALNYNYESLLENDKSIQNDLKDIGREIDNKFQMIGYDINEIKSKTDNISIQRGKGGTFISPKNKDEGFKTRPNWISNKCSVEKINYGSVFGFLSKSCKSKSRGNNKFAKYFKFIPNSNSTHIIDLIADTDTYLFLLDQNGNQISLNDDYNGHYKTSNSRIEKELESGKIYYIEATTFNDKIAIGIEVVISK